MDGEDKFSPEIHTSFDIRITSDVYDKLKKLFDGSPVTPSQLKEFCDVHHVDLKPENLLNTKKDDECFVIYAKIEGDDDIDLIMRQTSCPRHTAQAAYEENNGDLLSAILQIQRYE